jgi:membrane protein involved in colicin uptake
VIENDKIKIVNLEGFTEGAKSKSKPKSKPKSKTDLIKEKAEEDKAKSEADAAKAEADAAKAEADAAKAEAEKAKAEAEKAKAEADTAKIETEKAKTETGNVNYQPAMDLQGEKNKEETVDNSANVAESENTENVVETDNAVNEDSTENFTNYTNLYPDLNENRMNNHMKKDHNVDVKAAFKKQNCKNGELKYKNILVKNEMAPHIFSELNYTNGPCNPCLDTCKYSIIEEKMKTEEELVKPKNSNDFVSSVMSLLFPTQTNTVPAVRVVNERFSNYK